MKISHRTGIPVSSLLLFAILATFPAPAGAVPGGLTLTWKPEGANPVIFDGTAHEKKRLSCDACHIAGLFQTKYGADKMTMAAMQKGKYCGFCHNGKRAFGVVEQSACKRCHSGVKSGDARPNRK